MKNGSAKVAAALACAVIPSAAEPLAAQETAAAPSAEGDEIVVEGRRHREELINGYVKGVTAVSRNWPLARYAAGDYCPAVLGLSAARNNEIATRMRTVAAAAGVKPADEDCVPSALAIFIDDKAAFLAKFRNRHPKYFQQLPGRGRGLAEAEEPAVAWRIVQTSATNIPTGGDIIYSPYTPAVAMSVVVLERRAVIGLTTTQIADYVLMRTLTDPTPKAIGAPNDFTILGALEAPIGSAVPSSLTQWDLAYLKGRYSGHPARYSPRQAAAIRGAMRRALGEAATN
jgi:hypothetical protein